ncbi:sulfite exporter TauE/SafE family protein [Chryseobacterium sp. MFBS3-17]|uniref:sulfite exporter TauE/SafE family protein n=1 Tax=Chryseobacterium sp. MFBS3-17 TaxID=2886689 RepID=UPI001D0DCC9C|nr:sulfite exporter TauE/SafE family protein [Chryseobacterium sp. MFBS3-17]MCC2591271.1 sulfite exporter TauE/SafE family protein [Chryseobacterium sp. MFBS3-17]
MINRMKMDGITLIIGLVILGLIAGYLSGLVGIGGGIVMVPVLVLLFGFTQYKAQGTTLALLMVPVGFFGVMNYYKTGNVDVKTALLLCCGFMLGSYLGSKTAISLSQETLRKVFAVLMFVVAVKMFFQK